MDDETPAGESGLSLDQAADAFSVIFSGGSDDGDDASAGSDSGDGRDDADGLDDGDDEGGDLGDEGAEGRDEGEGDEGGEGGEPPAPAAAIKLKLPDGSEISHDEAVRGYVAARQFQQQLPAVEAEFRAVREERALYAQLLPQLKQALTVQEPDWDRLRAENPQGFAAAWAEHQMRQEQLRAVEAEQTRLTEAQRAEAGKALDAMRERELGALLQALPEWKDDATRTADVAKIRAYGRKSGFTERELEGVADHRALVVLRKAMLYDEMVGKRSDLRRNRTDTGPVPLKPGASKAGAGNGGAITKAKERLARTGRVEDAAAVFRRMI
ncbi:hypothetical protein [Azospirillum sp. ST 5-10]|uniref:hypothetical protein n=1 Tax=unclassified Azospirillum TaxID=2630922 RepID=UPI003F4A4394